MEATCSWLLMDYVVLDYKVELFIRMIVLYFVLTAHTGPISVSQFSDVCSLVQYLFVQIGAGYQMWKWQGHVYPRGKSPSTRWIGGWVGPKTCVDDVERRKLLSSQSPSQCSKTNQWILVKRFSSLFITFHIKPPSPFLLRISPEIRICSSIFRSGSSLV
jgi:hypothetical protein